jgi:outer membrane lipoprotein SlyB
MKKTLIIALFVLVAQLVAAQTIEKQKVMGGYKYLQDGKKLSLSKVGSLLESNPEAYTLFQSGKTQNGFASVLGGIGGALIGWPIGSAIGGGKPNWTLAGIGAAIAVIALPLGSSATKKMNRAVDIYNGKAKTGAISKPDLNLLVKANGLGIAWQF